MPCKWIVLSVAGLLFGEEGCWFFEASELHKWRASNAYVQRARERRMVWYAFVWGSVVNARAFTRACCRNSSWWARAVP